VLCYTDARSDKAKQINQNPGVSWLFYDPGERRQVRLEGQGFIHTDDDIAEAEWAGTSEAHRRLYAGPAPGFAPRQDQSPARSHFAVIRCRVGAVDWLDLKAPGHRRARFTWRNGNWRADWIAP
jgi:hypothetical protein